MKIKSHEPLSAGPGPRGRGLLRCAGALLGALMIFQGCGSSFQAGLSNAPGVNRQNRPRRQQDAIANGPEACPPNAPERSSVTNPACKTHVDNGLVGDAGR
jgi:hypothetical protein